MTARRSWAHPGFAGEIGVARRDITPSLDVRARCWGPAEHDVAEGVHRPLTLTALALRAAAGGDPLVLISADLTWWRRAAEESALRAALLEALDIEEARLLVHLVHTHAGPTLTTAEADLPGGAGTAAYLDGVLTAAVAASREAMATARPAVLEWTTGHCALAASRDLRDEDRVVTGFDPSGDPDTTLLVGRVSDAGGAPVATLVNYACHPTTLAWQNRLISPDWIGAAREVVEAHSGGAPCLVLQGASGELAPREQYVGETEIADRHGRAVGHAAVSALETMLAPAHALHHVGTMESGAPLALWRPAPRVPDRRLDAQRIVVRLAVQELPSLEQLEERWAHVDERARSERFARARQLRSTYGDMTELDYPVWAWRLGEASLVAHPGEAYSLMQRRLRQGRRAVAVLNCTNGPGFMYLPPAALYAEDAYPAWQTLVAAGSLERVTEAAGEALDALMLAHVGSPA